MQTFFDKIIRHYFQFRVIQLSPESICNTPERLRCSIIFNYHSQSPSNGWEPVPGWFFSASELHAWSNSPVLGGTIMPFPMKINTGCAMEPVHSKKQSKKVSKPRPCPQRLVPRLSKLLWDREAPRAAHAACGWRCPRGVGNPICLLHQAAWFMPVFKTFFLHQAELKRCFI